MIFSNLLALSFTLVGKFLVYRPNLDSIQNYIAIFLPVCLILEMFLFNDLDYSKVFARRTYYILNCQMRLLKWTLFDVKEESPIVPIWISFLNLCLHFFNSHVLDALGSNFDFIVSSHEVDIVFYLPFFV